MQKSPSIIHPQDKKRKILDRLFIELVKLQKEIISANLKLLVILEGRDAAGKDGTIKRIIKHLSTRETRVVALGKPSDRQDREWYFQRYAPNCRFRVSLSSSTEAGTTGPG